MEKISVLQNQPNIEKEVRIETVERQECVVFIDAIKKGIILFGQENFIKFMKRLSAR